MFVKYSFRRSLRALLSLALLGPLGGCRSSDIRLQQLQLHESVTRAVEQALVETSANLVRYTARLRQLYTQDTHCELPKEANTASSVYYPKSAVAGHRANCFVAATKVLEPEWQTFYERSGYVSWIYSYDSDTRVKRILPSANTKMLFGENLIFDSFSFYHDAVVGYPKPAFTKVKEDINGTGRIVIATQAVQLPQSKRYTVVSIDVRLNQIIKDRYSDIQNFALRNRLAHLFIFSYYRDPLALARTIVSDFSTDVTLWNQLKPQDNQSLNLLSGEKGALEALETEADQRMLSVASREVTLRGEKYLCSLSRVKSLPVFFLMCSLP